MTARSKSQRWIMEEFYRIHDVFAFRAKMFVEWGFKQADIERTTARIRHPRMVQKQWQRTADQQREMAEQAEREGRRETAAEFYHRASLYYGPAVTTIYANTPLKRELYSRLVECYEGFIRNFDGWVERVEIPFEGRSIPGIFQGVPGGQRTPCVICVPGMDTIKEYFPNPYNNPFVRRGIATLTIDGPGQGESNVRELWVTLDNFERAGSAVLDYLATRPEVDPGRIGLYGWSMGSYWGPRIAARDPRLKACVAAMGVYLDKEIIFNEARPTYKQNYMYMSNIPDEAAFDRVAREMTLEPLASRIRCPMLLIMGEFDELCPLEDAERFFEMLPGPKELWVFEDQNHTLGDRLADMYPLMADWLKERLLRDEPEAFARRRWFAAR